MTRKSSGHTAKHRPPKRKGLVHTKKPKTAPSPQSSASKPKLVLYGLHAVKAALVNENRKINRIWLTKSMADRLKTDIANRGLSPINAEPADFEWLCGPDAVHQGVAADVEPIPFLGLDDLPDEGLLLALDQITDPHNVGAILRSAAAFGVRGLIMTDRHSPPFSGVLAKAASGGLEQVPIVIVTNLARTLNELGERGFMRIGLDGSATTVIAPNLRSQATVLVLGAEGKGLRHLTKEHCGQLCKIQTKGALTTLNVSNAAAIALHILQDDQVTKSD